MAAMNKYKNMNKNKTTKYHVKKRRKPLVLDFDDQAREDFLTGFRKRKLQRKKKAQEELEVELKAEKKRIKVAAKNALQNLVVSHRDIPELAQFREDEANIVDMDTHQVHITELDSAKLARDNNWIGINQVRYNENKPDAEDDGDNENEIDGMEIKSAKKVPTKINAQTDFKSQKDLKKYIKQMSAKNVKSSKAFQKKKDVEKVKNKKKKRKEEKRTEKNTKKFRNKREKHKKRRP